jgi:hypothetical protein
MVNTSECDDTPAAKLNRTIVQWWPLALLLVAIVFVTFVRSSNP